jgi:hypothetical protein
MEMSRVTPNVDRPSTASECEADEVLQMVHSAREKLRAWVESKTGAEREAAFQRIGLNEGLSLLMTIASLGEDLDGKLSSTELEKFHEESEKTITAHMDSLTNAGVVSALILSVIFPIAYDIETTQSSNAFKYFEYFFLQLAVAGSITTIFGAGGVFTQLSFFLPTNKLRIWFINEINCYRIMPCIEGMKNCSLVLLALALVAHQLNRTMFPLNLVSFVPFILVIVALCMWGYANGQIILPKMQQGVAELVSNKRNSVPHNPVLNGYN